MSTEAGSVFDTAAGIPSDAGNHGIVSGKGGRTWESLLDLL